MIFGNRSFICDSSTFNLKWFAKNIMVPLPFKLNEEVLRLYVTFCDDDNVGRVGFVDVNIEDPTTILGVSEKPVIDIGPPGSFTDSGIVTSSLLNLDGVTLLYYSGYQRCTNVPYMVFSGVAQSVDGGLSFQNLSNTPILDRIENETMIRSSVSVLPRQKGYRIFYSSESSRGWVSQGEKKLPTYDLKYLDVESPTKFEHKSGNVCLGLESDDEIGISKIAFLKNDESTDMIFALRSLSKGYSFGLARAHDGLTFARKGSDIGFGVSAYGWDSQMVTFPSIFRNNGRTFLFYCGNNYGAGGLGFVEIF